jgi:hypothetical protein
MLPGDSAVLLAATTPCRLQLASNPITATGPRWLSRYNDSLLVGRSGNRIPVRGEIFRTRPGALSLLYNGYRDFTGVKWLGLGADHPPRLEPRLKKE